MHKFELRQKSLKKFQDFSRILNVWPSDLGMILLNLEIIERQV